MYVYVYNAYLSTHLVSAAQLQLLGRYSFGHEWVRVCLLCAFPNLSFFLSVSQSHPHRSCLLLCALCRTLSPSSSFSSAAASVHSHRLSHHPSAAASVHCLTLHPCLLPSLRSVSPSHHPCLLPRLCCLTISCLTISPTSSLVSAAASAQLLLASHPHHRSCLLQRLHSYFLASHPHHRSDLRTAALPCSGSSTCGTAFRSRTSRLYVVCVCVCVCV
jgi:hypothetical protein